MNQLDSRDGHLRPDASMQTLNGLLVADAHYDAVRKSRPVEISASVLMHARKQAVDRRPANLEDGVKITC